MTPELQILLRARELVAAGWTQGESARDAGGQKVSLFSESARCFCSLGALSRAEDEMMAPPDSWVRAVHFLRSHTNGIVTHWNDAPGRTQADVVEAFSKAIVDAEKAEISS